MDTSLMKSLGNDPFDYEKKFAEDKQYDELGSAARVWRIYLEECAASNGEMVEGWRDGLDVLLVFVSTIVLEFGMLSLIEEKAGLFSAVVTTFVAQTSQSLQVDYSEVTASLLIELINVQRSASNGSLVNDVPRSDLAFRPSMSDSWVNGLWFISLSLSLTAALFAVLTKQWIHQYLSVPSGTPRDRCHVRQFRYMGLEQWRVGFIIGLLPVLMSASLAVFLVGLVLFIIPLRVSIASVVGAITFISFSAYIVTNFLPILYPSCPYKTPLSQYMFPLYAYIRRRIPGSSTAHTLREAESTVVRVSADEMDVQALVWLINVSSNPSVESIVIESTSALPLKSVDSFKYLIDHTNVPSACMQALEHLVREPDVSVHESKVDRLIRATFRFTRSPDLFDAPQPAKDCFSPTLYADLLCIQPGCEEEIQELVMSNLMASDDDFTALRLHPIIWARLLWRVLHSDSSPDKLEVMQMLFSEIPSSYWKADYVPITYALESFGMKIPPESDDGEVTLRMAIQSSLYIYVSENILCRHMLSEPTIFRQNNSDVNQDSRLRLLLSMAGSRSMRSMAYSHLQSMTDEFWRHIPLSSFTSNRSLFITIVESTDDFVDIASSHKDNARRTVLEFLYTLITSVEFDAPLTPREQTSALMMLFRVLNFTCSRPPCLQKDWCTPQLATKFVRISLRAYWSDAGELGSYVFQHTSFTNETLAFFISNIFEELRTEINDGALQTFLRLVITELGSEDLGVHTVRRQSLEYLHEPDNLFTSCVALIWWRDTWTLRRLALLYPEHHSWPDCLQRLEESEMEESLVANLKAFIEVGRVGAFGEDHDDTSSSEFSSIVSSQEENDKPPQHLWSTTQSTYPPLPQELVDYIIDILTYDIPTLRSCSLVCRSFLPRSRELLFREVDIGTSPLRQSEAVLSI
ncbi:uncharacterized protein ARMOST_04520 [Armillaria ostoyae]|uniref:DUF6535 domain-containing protein n=1 Tax=Armillaria ostoyae TaxID=47428 RepID=A0A284QXT8_ARMOS|nr:uncharacterized protein ARMOST_04520 [Armillaria ostoyae]